MNKDCKTLIILAGGFGTRLAKVVEDVPKPLADVNGAPFLRYILESYRSQGIDNFIFLLHHKADQIVGFVAQESETGVLKGCSHTCITEKVPLGTGGAIANAVHELRLNGSFYVTNADTWLDCGIGELNDCTGDGIAVVNVSDASRFGTVLVENGRVIRFLEKENLSKPGLINAGLYKLHAELFSDWNQEAFSIETMMFPKLVADGKLAAAIIDSQFIDIGVPEDYFRFKAWVASGRGHRLE